MEAEEATFYAMIKPLQSTDPVLCNKLIAARQVKIMNKMPFNESQNSEEELLAEYQFDYKKAKPNRFATQSGKQLLKVVVLDEDVAQNFTTSESVNKTLMESMLQLTDSDTA